jgi:hypothetical protein
LKFQNGPVDGTIPVFYGAVTVKNHIVSARESVIANTGKEDAATAAAALPRLRQEIKSGAPASAPGSAAF